MATGCERSFMRKADLVSHAQNHSGTVHKCDQCEYSARSPTKLPRMNQKILINLIAIRSNNCGYLVDVL